MSTAASSSSAPILVATDLSDAADEAIRVGHERALRSSAPLVVAHVIEYAAGLHPMLPHLAQPETSALLGLEQRVSAVLVERVRSVTAREDGDFATEVHVGNPYSSIVTRAEQIGAGLIVVASRGRRGIERLLIGRVAERIVEYAPCSVLVARPHAATGRILCATDLSDASVPAVHAGVEELRARGGELTVIHVLEVPASDDAWLGTLGALPGNVDRDTLEQLRQGAVEVLEGQLARFGAEGRVRVLANINPDAAIVKLAGELSTDLVVVGAKGRSGLLRMVLGSVADSVIRHTHCSVLAVRVA